ncbi:lipocalin family protein [Gramella sp. AN32]|uniref:Lipocalin family protein n=1 Tax=Christiangramia antarctica TaxID=2058158 RepID=A0ABW5X796_9FLAO|nr:lipocalin family protein [Gramella sp. AN32]MCM4154448.1 hypothetical protein [Gramella sp. AN32]
MKRISLLLLFLFISCGKNSPEEMLQYIDGYWQIEKVEVEKDSVVEFGLSQYVDFIEIKDSLGFRKKLQPKLDGGFLKTNSEENIKIDIRGEQLFFQYSTPFNTWEEEILETSPDVLVTKNKEGKIYYYKRFEPLLNLGDEKKKE